MKDHRSFIIRIGFVFVLFHKPYTLYL